MFQIDFMFCIWCEQAQKNKRVRGAGNLCVLCWHVRDSGLIPWAVTRKRDHKNWVSLRAAGKAQGLEAAPVHQSCLPQRPSFKVWRCGYRQQVHPCFQYGQEAHFSGCLYWFVLCCSTACISNRASTASVWPWDGSAKKLELRDSHRILREIS